jgi:hypothetical protein
MVVLSNPEDRYVHLVVCCSLVVNLQKISIALFGSSVDNVCEERVW